MWPEGKRGEYVTEEQAQAITANFQTTHGKAVKADVFRLSYLLGVRKGQLRATTKQHVVAGPVWKLKWPEDVTKNGEVHEVALHGEALMIVKASCGTTRDIQP